MKEYPVTSKLCWLCTTSFCCFFFVKVGFNSITTNEAFGSYETQNKSTSFALSKEKESLHKKLFKAVAAGDLQELDALLANQVSFGVQNFDKRTPL